MLKSFRSLQAAPTPRKSMNATGADCSGCDADILATLKSRVLSDVTHDSPSLRADPLSLHNLSWRCFTRPENANVEKFATSFAVSCCENAGPQRFSCWYLPVLYAVLHLNWRLECCSCRISERSVHAPVELLHSSTNLLLWPKQWGRDWFQEDLTAPGWRLPWKFDFNPTQDISGAWWFIEMTPDFSSCATIALVWSPEEIWPSMELLCSTCCLSETVEFGKHTDLGSAQRSNEFLEESFYNKASHI